MHGPHPLLHCLAMQPQARSMHPLHPMHPYGMQGMHGMQGRVGLFRNGEVAVLHREAMQPQAEQSDATPNGAERCMDGSPLSAVPSPFRASLASHASYRDARDAWDARTGRGLRLHCEAMHGPHPLLHCFAMQPQARFAERVAFDGLSTLT